MGYVMIGVINDRVLSYYDSSPGRPHKGSKQCYYERMGYAMRGCIMIGWLCYERVYYERMGYAMRGCIMIGWLWYDRVCVL